MKPGDLRFVRGAHDIMCYLLEYRPRGDDEQDTSFWVTGPIILLQKRAHKWKVLTSQGVGFISEYDIECATNHPEEYL